MQCNAIKSNNILFFLYFLLWIKWNDVFHLKICYFILIRKQRTALWWAERWHLASHHMRMYWEYIALQLILWADVIPFEIVSLEILNHKSLYFIMFYMLELRFTFLKYIFQVILLLMPKYESLFIICNFSMWNTQFQVYILLAKSLSHLILGQKQD